MPYLESKTALVTGAGRGIGRAIAQKLAEYGASVMVNDLDAAPAAETAALLPEQAASRSWPATSPIRPFPRALVDATLERFGSLDIIVNNAGYTWDNVIQKTTDEQFQAMLDIHLVAPFRILRAASDWIRETAKRETAEGRRVMRKVVNITSIAGTDGNAGQAGYSSGKAGVIGFTKTMAKEWGRYNVNVNAVGFGLIETRLTQPMAGRGHVHRHAGPQDQGRRAAQDARNGQRRLPAGPHRHARRSRQRGAVLLLAALRLRHRRSPDLRRRPALSEGRPLSAFIAFRRPFLLNSDFPPLEIVLQLRVILSATSALAP